MNPCRMCGEAILDRPLQARYHVDCLATIHQRRTSRRVISRKIVKYHAAVITCRDCGYKTVYKPPPTSERVLWCARCAGWTLYGKRNASEKRGTA